MTNAKKAQLVDLIEAYGTYQFMLGRGGVDAPAWYLDRVKEICEELREDFGVELVDLAIIA